MKEEIERSDRILQLVSMDLRRNWRAALRCPKPHGPRAGGKHSFGTVGYNSRVLTILVQNHMLNALIFHHGTVVAVLVLDHARNQGPDLFRSRRTVGGDHGVLTAGSRVCSQRGA
jgi:hypothetical protein